MSDDFDAAAGVPTPWDARNLPPDVDDWLDRRAPVDEALLTRHQRQRVAELFLLDSCLQQLYRPDPAAREQLIQRVCLSVRPVAATSSPTPSRRSRLSRVWRSMALALTLLGAVYLWRGSLFESPALAALNATLKASEQPGDRHYKVTAKVALPFTGDRRWLGDLWVSGPSRFVWRQPTTGGELVLGTDGRDHWLVPPVGPVIRGSEPGVLAQALVGDRPDGPFLQISSILTRMRDRYDLQLLPETELDEGFSSDKIRCTHLLATRRSDTDASSPDRIELWAARQSGLVQRVTLDWNTPRSNLTLKSLSFDLAPLESSLPETWYGHAQHHDPVRQ